MFAGTQDTFYMHPELGMAGDSTGLVYSKGTVNSTFEVFHAWGLYMLPNSTANLLPSIVAKNTAFFLQGYLQTTNI